MQDQAASRGGVVSDVGLRELLHSVASGLNNSMALRVMLRDTAIVTLPAISAVTVDAIRMDAALLSSVLASFAIACTGHRSHATFLQQVTVGVLHTSVCVGR